MTTASTPEQPVCDCGDPECPGRIEYTWPFKINAETTDGTVDGLVGYYSVRTHSSDWDGERTDLHDLLSLLLAILLRAREVASAHLVAELNGFSGIDSEIYARLVAFKQEGSLAPLRGRAYFEALSELSRAAHDMVLDMFGVPAAGPDDWRDGGADYRSPPAWVEAARRRLRLKTMEDWEFNHRKAFGAKVFTSIKRGVTIAELGEASTATLRRWLDGFKPASFTGPTRTSYRSSKLVNAVPNKSLEQARAFLRMVEGSSPGDVVIPLENYLVLIGWTTLVALRAPCGAEEFHHERAAVQARHEAEADVFLEEVDVVWSDKLDDGRFENLIGELISRERGVLRVRQVGATREADDGRDFLVDWALPPRGATTAGVSDGAATLLEHRHVIAQVKIRAHGVGRQHLPGLRDTIDHYRCSGLLIVAYPNVTTTLTDHLETLRREQRYWIDWWGRTEIERRIRRYPELAARYGDLLTIRK